MKIAGDKVRTFLSRTDPDIVGILVYGPDRGLVRERADKIVGNAVDDPSDPFRVSEISADQLKSDAALLSDEVNALTLTGGRRVVRLRAATDAISAIFKQLLKAQPFESLVVLEAAELGPRSSLRQLFERTGKLAALACYSDDSRSLQMVISETLARHQLSAGPEVRAWLEKRLGSDRLATRSELEKLALYVGKPGSLSMEDAVASVGDGSAANLDGVVLAAAGGEKKGLDRVLERAFEEGIPPVRVLRALARHLLRLHQASGMTAQGKTPDQAMKELRPPVFFKLCDQFRKQLRGWPQPRLAKALEMVTEAEIDCKTTGLPDRAICSRTLMLVAQLARQVK